ncbi:tRNase Z endonuclease-domain-containing protein [Chytridium lagenaria]|nr:tRNase Z endonuclease-domain-containing protein [Chytridium lagenaria]
MLKHRKASSLFISFKVSAPKKRGVTAYVEKEKARQIFFFCPTAMKSFIQILGGNTGDTSPCILAFFDTQRYLFNVGEGAQRFCMENKVRLSKLNNIFITKVGWDAVGGIPGMLLTLADAGNNVITIHGGKNLTHMLAACRPFVFRMSSGVRVHEIHEESSHYMDENLDVKSVVIYPVHCEAEIRRKI